MIARKFALVTVTVALVSAALLSSIPQTAKADEIIPDTSLVLQDKIAGSTTVSYATNGGVTTPKGVFKIYPNQQFTLQGTRRHESGTESITVTWRQALMGQTSI
jgi:H+/gluconate symporter-like permease